MPELMEKTTADRECDKLREEVAMLDSALRAKTNEILALQQENGALQAENERLDLVVRSLTVPEGDEL